jgi:hypothetical protein
MSEVTAYIVTEYHEDGEPEVRRFAADQFEEAHALLEELQGEDPTGSYWSVVYG